VGDLLVKALVQEGLSEAEAHSRLWLLSSRGLLHSGLQNLSSWQQRYCHPQEQVAAWGSDNTGTIPLLEVIDRVHPTALIGVCGQAGAFTEEAVRRMARHVERPIIFPLSNPTSCSEAVPGEVLAWTEGRALVATGSPFASVAYQGRTIPISQCNNTYIFPGLGLGVIAAGARGVTDEMFLTAARVLSECVPEPAGRDTPLLPPLRDIPEVSWRIARAVGLQAQHQGLSPQTSAEDWERTLASRRWEPRYRPLRYWA
jgi:malate dehydrogenase (oxaloacetate-decarboxylating)